MGEFNQNKYIQEWKKEHMTKVTAAYNKEFVEQFKTACKKLGITQSKVIREAMEATIEKAKNS